jgi:hypothetical protein
LGYKARAEIKKGWDILWMDACEWSGHAEARLVGYESARRDGSLILSEGGEYMRTPEESMIEFEEIDFDKRF